MLSDILCWNLPVIGTLLGTQKGTKSHFLGTQRYAIAYLRTCSRRACQSNLQGPSCAPKKFNFLHLIMSLVNFQFKNKYFILFIYVTYLWCRLRHDEAKTVVIGLRQSLDEKDAIIADLQNQLGNKSESIPTLKVNWKKNVVPISYVHTKSS